MMLDRILLGLLVALPLSRAVSPLVNLTFEDGTWGDWTLEPGGTGDNLTVVSPGYGGSKHAGAHVITDRDGSLIVYAPTFTNMTLGQQYTISADFKSNNPHCSTAFQNFEGILMSFGNGLKNITNGTWGTYSATFVPQSRNDSFNIATFCSVPANEPVPHGPAAEFDNILVQPVGKPFTNSSAPTGTNLIKQPSFGSGTLKAYQVTTSFNASAKIKSPGYNGSANAVHILLTGAFGQPAAASLLQTVAETKKSGVYKLSFAWKLNKKLSTYCGGESFIQEAGFPTGTQYIPYQYVTLFPTDESNPPPVGQWTPYEGFVTGLGDGFEVGILLQCLFEHGDFEIDDIQLVPYS
jgi:hypothetical protein